MTPLAFLLLALLSALALAGCRSPAYDDPPPRFNPQYMGPLPPPVSTMPSEPMPPVIATDVLPPRETPPPRLANPQTAKLPPPDAGQGREWPVGTPVAGKPGFVTSPYKPYAGYVDVRGFSPGEQVKCPYSGKIFLVP